MRRKNIPRVLCHSLMSGLCATASESSETQCLRFFHSNRRALRGRRRSHSGTLIFRRDRAVGCGPVFEIDLVLRKLVVLDDLLASLHPSTLPAGTFCRCLLQADRRPIKPENLRRIVENGERD